MKTFCQIRNQIFRNEKKNIPKNICCGCNVTSIFEISIFEISLRKSVTIILSMYLKYLAENL